MNTQQLDRFDERVVQSRLQIYRSLGCISEHPILPRAARICPSRGLRHSEASREKVAKIETPREKCLFCKGGHPSVLSYLNLEMEVVIPAEQASFDAARTWLAGKDPTQIQTFYDLTTQLRPYNRIDSHLVRSFLNLTPAVVAPDEACIVTAVHPDYHDDDLAEIPLAVLGALVRAWQLGEAWGRSRGLTVVPFINGGRRAPSGQSVGCLHGQLYAVHGIPTLFEAIRRRREARWNGDCPVCALQAQDGLQLWQDPSGSVRLLADPAPLHNWSLLVLPTTHDARLGAIDPDAFAAAIQTAVRGWRKVFGVEPALNVLVRCGEAVGHAFAELVPRTETNVLAGFELDTHDNVISVPPDLVVREFSRQLSPIG